MLNVAKLEKLGRKIYDALETEAMIEDLRFTLIEVLTDREFDAITRLIGLEDGQPWTVDDIVMDLGVPEERLLQIFDQALRTLRKYAHLVPVPTF